ncbi:ATP-binding protein [candidate division KSB1 bacterium]|nr:ATP-binding protein [candidate division KSB1 bacterium]MBL7094241.1 ATP-binding protein [candidate division KSB1 bacterium]
MFNRSIISDLENWSNKINRKPLILRGARQVGKTTAVNIFASQFDQYIYLNLEIAENRKIFEQDLNFDELQTAIFFYKDKKKEAGKTLVFIDEIQNSPAAIAQLRYFYESAKELFVIAAGSLFESIISNQISFPVGRVEYLYMKPLTFREFLSATGENESAELIDKIPFPRYAHNKLLKQFYLYTLIGGMPEVVKTYVESKDIILLNSIYESLLVSYLDDVEKYARNTTLARVIRHAIQSCFFEAGKRIKFQGFGNSNYKSREMGEALKTLEKAMLIKLIYPTTSLKLPIIPDYKKSPKLFVLDTGLINYFVGLQKELFGAQDLNNIYEGKIAEHIVGQELIARRKSFIDNLCFWVREKKQSNAEIDFVISFDNKIFPIEVKTGSSGQMRSFFQFLDSAPHNFGVRIYSGELKIDKITSVKGKEIFLLNLPFYLVGEIEGYLEWFIKSKL